MSAGKAFKAAQAAIARTIEIQATRLVFDSDEFRDLDRLPPEIAEFTKLTYLNLDNTMVSDLSPLQNMVAMHTLALNNTPVRVLSPLQGLVAMQELWFGITQVSDLSPLQDMVAMQKLWFGNTQVSDLSPLQGMREMVSLRLDNTLVSDLAPLQGMVAMRTLLLDKTQVSDLRPLADMYELGSIQGTFGIRFTHIPALALDPRLAEIAEIDDDLERSVALLDRLDQIGDDWPPLPPLESAPEQEAAPRVSVQNGKVDVQLSTPSPDELEDCVKQQALERLRQAVDRLAQVANRHPDLDLPSRNLRQNLSVPFAEMDLLEVHFELEELRGIYERRAEREDGDKFDPDVVSALDRIGFVGPGLTLDNAEVEAFEARRGRYLDLPSALKAMAENHELSRSIIENPELYGEIMREYSALFLRSDDRNRTAAGESILNRNTVITVGLIFSSGLVAGPLGNVGVQAMEWLAANSVAISALAPGWGEAFQVWISPVLMRAREASATAKAVRGK